MLKKILSSSLVIILSACTIKPFGSKTLTTETYYYENGLNSERLWSCLEDQLTVKGYYVEREKLDIKAPLNRISIFNGNTNIGFLDLFINDNRVSSMAIVGGDSAKVNIDNAQKECVKLSRKNYW